MKKIFYSIALCLFCAVSSATEIEPLANKYEARIIKEAQSEPDIAKRAQILCGALSDERAGAALIFNAANASAQNSDRENAARLFALAIEKMPNFYMARRNLAYVKFENADYKNALSEFAAALSLSSADAAKIYAAMGVCHANLGNFSEALTCFEMALVFSPNDLNLLKSKAKCLLETGADAPLEELVLELLKADCRDANLWRILARLNLKKGEKKSACAALEAMRALGIAENADCVLLADIYEGMGIFEEAADIYAASKIPPEKAYEIARHFALSNRPDEALKAAQSLDKNSWQYFEIRGIAALSKGENALEFFEKSHAQNPQNPFVCLKLADIHLSEKNLESARIFYAAAGDFKEQSLAGLANVEIAAGNFAEAQKILERLKNEFKRDDLNGVISKLKEAENGSK
ncbi:MAG: tetratricopeptide repeat protein [Opitutales bacterium]|nr:tetratricopeptide repeat protein [Opitutales bacterium]